MLVLTRKTGETIRVGENIVIKVIQTGKGSVKLGIEAPSNVRVLRGELQAFETPATKPAEQFRQEIEAEIHQFLADFGDLYDVEFEDASVEEHSEELLVAAH